MSQQININLANGSFLVPCYQKDADVFQSGLAYNTTNLNIQLATVDGSFYNYSGSGILNGTTPSNTGEVGFYQLHPTSYIAKVQLHSSTYSNLIIGSGQNIGMLALTASGFAPIVSTLVFGPLETNVVQISGQNVAPYDSVTVDPTGIRDAIGLSSANLDTQLADISGNVSYTSTLMNEIVTGTTPNRQFTTLALENAPAGSGGSGGSGDWTTTEKAQIRYILGIDGSVTAPTGTPNAVFDGNVITFNGTSISGSNGIFDVNLVQINGASASGAGTVAVDPTGIRNAVGLASASLDSQLSALSAGGSGLTTIPWNTGWYTEVQSGVQNAIVANHLDHLFAVDYDPASKPGVSTALLNELVGDDGAGVSQFTASALELGPTGSGGSGGSGDWTTTEKSQIRYMLGIDGTKAIPSSGPSGIYLSDIRYVNGVAASGTGTVSIDAAEIRSAVGLSSANLDTQLGDIPTVSEFNARTLPSGEYADVNVVSMDSGVVTTIQSGLSTLDAAGIRTAVGLASANLDTQISVLPTTGDLTARTIVASGYATQAELDKVIKSGESRTLTRSGKTDVTYVDTRD